MSAVRKLPRQVPLFTNAADTVYLYAPRPCWWLPRTDGLADPPEVELGRMRAAAATGHLVIAYSTRMEWRAYSELPLDEVLAAVQPRARVQVPTASCTQPTRPICAGSPPPPQPRSGRTSPARRASGPTCVVWRLRELLLSDA